MKKHDEDKDDDLIQIDVNDIEQVWVDHPRLVRRYCTLLADAELRAETLKAQLELVSAELDSAIRARPEKYIKGKGRVTDTAVRATLVQNEEYQFQLNILNKAKRKVTYLKGMVRTLEHRKSALQDIVELKRQDLGAEPRLPKGAGDAVEMLKKRAARGGLQRKYQDMDEDDDPPF